MCHGLVPPNGTEMEHEIQFRRFPVQRKLSHLYCLADVMEELSYLPLKGRVTLFPSRFTRFVSSPVEIRTKHRGAIMGFEEWPERFRGSRGGRKRGASLTQKPVISLAGTGPAKCEDGTTCFSLPFSLSG